MISKKSIFVSFLVGFFILSSVFVPSDGFDVTVSAVLDIIKLAKDIVISIGKAWSLIDDHVDISEIPLPLLDKTQQKVFARMALIDEKLTDLSTLVDSVGTNTIMAVLQNLPQQTRFELRLNDLLDYLTRLNVFYLHMSQYVEHRNEFARLTLEEYATTVVSTSPSSVTSLVERVHAFIAPTDTGIVNTGILHLMVLWPHDINYGLEMMDNVWDWSVAYSNLRGIYAVYEAFRRFQEQETTPERIPAPKLAWIDIAESVLNDSVNSVSDALDKLHRTLVRDNIFLSVKNEAEKDMRCNTKQSPQQVLYNLYNAIALTELKGYAMIQFSYMLLKLYNRGNFTKEAEFVRNRYQQRTNEAIAAVKDAMQHSSRHYYKCDPKRHIKDETYVEVTQLLQGFVQNEVDMNPDQTCRENCGEYTYTKSHGCFKNLYCNRQRPCNGKIINCRYVDSDMWICPADPRGGRRYEYIEYENGKVLGRKMGCSRGVTKVDSWWRWLFWHCSYCFCFCDESGVFSDRYFNMRPTFANISYNRVVTGLRFVKNNRIIHLQIQEGKLLPRGQIDPETVKWVPVDDYKITDRNIYNSQDYHTLSWEKRAMDLDDLEADEGHVVTGIRFKEIGSHLNFEIYVTPFNFETGLLQDPDTKSLWKDNPNTDASVRNPRTRVHLINPDISTRSQASSEVDSRSDQYIEFTHTDIDRDAAQTTVPFIDAQKVESLQPVPLSGAGIFHKGFRNFGGFIAPKVITYDFSKHLQVAFPDELDNNEPLVN